MSLCWQVMAHEVLDAMPQALMVVDASGRILADNAFARGLLKEGDPLVSDVSGRLRGSDFRTNSQIIRLFASFRSPRTAVVVGASLPRRDGRTSVQVVLRRLHGPGPGKGLVLLAAADSGRVHAPAPFLLQQLYRLTPGEARVASAAASGVRCHDIARQLRIGVSTAQTHLRNVYRKTGVRSRPQLVRKILCGPLWFPAGDSG